MHSHGTFNFRLTVAQLEVFQPLQVQPEDQRIGPHVAKSLDEGVAATNGGTFDDADGRGTVTISASVGTVMQDNTTGTWTWLIDAPDGPTGPVTVTITATDDKGAAATTTFVYAVDNVPPTISLSGAATVNEGSPYTLNLGPVYDPGQDIITSYTIDWGDGTVQNFTGHPANTTATHTYTDGPNNRTYEVRVTDEDGTFLAGSLSVQVLNVAPAIALNGPASVNEGSTYTLAFGPVLDPGTDTVSGYTIDWGDGSSPQTFSGSPANTTKTHVYADGPNNYTICVSLTDEDGTYPEVATLPVAVANAAPVVAAISPAVTVNEGQTATNTGTWSDAGQDVVTLSASAGIVTKNDSGTWSWSFSTVDGPHGSQTVTITATDSDGASTGITFNLVVENVAPTATFNAPATGVEGTASTVSFTGASDASSADAAAGFEYTFDFGNGYSDWSATNSASFTPPDDGTYMVRGKVRDKDGGVTEYTATVSVANVAPEAKFANGGAVGEGSAGSVSFLGQVDPSSADVAAGFRYAYDFDNDGTFEVGGDGSYAQGVAAASAVVSAEYLADGPGSRTVRGRIIDKDGGFTDYKTTIEVYNVAPNVAADDETVTVNEGQTAANTGTWGDPGQDTVSLAASVGTVTRHDDGTWSWSFDTNDGPDGSQTVAISATDSDGLKTTTTFALVVKNVAPTFEAGPNETVQPAALGLFSRTGIAITDPGSPENFTGTVNFGDGTGDHALAIDAVTRTFNLSHTYPHANTDPAVNTYTVTVTVNDGDGGRTPTPLRWR